MSWPIILVLIGVAALLVIVAVLLWRSRNAWPALPPWAWRNILALIAIIATIGGAAVLTAISVMVTLVMTEDADRLINELVRDINARKEVGDVLIIIYKSMATNQVVTNVGILVILVSLGLAITARKVKGEAFGGKFEMSGGEDDDAVAAAADAVAGAATDKAEQVKDALPETPAAAPAPTPKPDDPNIPDYAR